MDTTGTPDIRKIYNPDPQEKKDIKFVYDRKQLMEDSQDRHQALTRADKGRKAWESYREEKSESQWQSNHVVPMTFAVVETALSEVVPLRLRPIIQPQGGEDIPRAKVMQHVFDYSCDISGWDGTIVDIWQDTFIDGTAIAQEYYWVDKRLVTSVTMGKNKKEEKKQIEILDYDDVYLESVRLGDFFVDEKAEGFSGPKAARDCIRRYIMDIDDFKAYFKGDIWDPLGNVQYVRPGGNINYYEWYKPPEGIKKDREVEVLWYWSKRPEDRLWIVANDVLVKQGGNPYKHKQLPFAKNVDVKRTHKFYGKGEPEILESIQDEANTHRRMTIDRSHLDIDKMFIVSSRASLSDEDLIARPHGMIPSDDVNMTRAVEYGDVPNSVELSYKHLEDDSVISTGINPRAQSLPVAGSATEAALLKEATLKRIQKKIWMMKMDFLPIISRLRCANILQFYAQPRLEEIVGEEGTADYKAEMTKLADQGLLLENNGKTYKKTYREIPLQGKQMQVNPAGQIAESTASGTTFFLAKPEYFIPAARGGYTLKFDSAETIQVSKTLQQTKDLELFDRLVPLIQMGVYDAAKVGDMMLTTYGKRPDDLKPDQQRQSDTEMRLELLIKLATMENDQMMQGQPIPATPNASPAHTQIHLAKVESEQFKALSNESPIIKIFTDHITGEIMAIEARNQGGGVPPGPGQPPLGGPGGVPAPGANPLAPGGLGAGVTNRPGGVKKPTQTMGDTLPGFKTGGERNAL